jgi:hypothetical protein
MSFEDLKAIFAFSDGKTIPCYKLNGKYVFTQKKKRETKSTREKSQYNFV